MQDTAKIILGNCESCVRIMGQIIVDRAIDEYTTNRYYTEQN